MIKPCLCFTILICSALSALPPQQPVIGIFTQSIDETGVGFDSYFPASYVKNLEMAGAQVVPIFYHLSQTKLEDLLSKINGVFFPGGEMPIDRSTQWTQNTQFILEYANRQNKANNPFPIWATCLGYEAVMYITSGRNDNMTVLTEVFGQTGKTFALSVKNPNSILLKSLNAKELEEVTTGDGLFYFHHRWAITLKTYNESPELKSFWKLVSTSFTADKVEFVSTVEAFDYPYFMTQYHPEKNSFQWRVPAKRTYNAISVEQKFINEFMKKARMSRNRISDAELQAKVIYNYQATAPKEDAFVQIYKFDERNL